MTDTGDEPPETDASGLDADDASDLDSADAFSLLGDQTRLRIVSVLHDDRADAPIQFSALYERVDVGDSAQFNYHLKQLTPHFVTKVGERGYELTAAGRRLARAVAAGTYTDSPRLDPFEIDGTCYACGEDALRAAYEDETFTIDCRACGERLLEVRVPPTVVRDGDPETVVDAFDRWSRTQVRQATRGVCPDCGGAVEPSVVDDVSEPIAFEALAAFECAVCGRRTVTSFGGIASQTPEVEQFHRRRGASLRDRPYWEIPQYVAGDHVRVVSRDPWSVGVSFFANGDACHVEIDGDLAVDRIEIVPGETPSGEE